MSNKFCLSVQRGPNPKHRYSLTRSNISIGRDIINDIAINDPEVSRQHCELIRTSESYEINDLGSKNGTFVNGKRIYSYVQLVNGDTIGLGETVTLRFELASQRPIETNRPSIRVHKGPGSIVGQVFELDRSISVIGRSTDCDIFIDETETSRRHCKMTETSDGQYKIRDLGSTNGTFINGKRLSSSHKLTPGDQIGLGEYVTLVFEVPTHKSYVPASSFEIESARVTKPEYVFISYAHADNYVFYSANPFLLLGDDVGPVKFTLLQTLIPTMIQANINLWYDRYIPSGENWQSTIRKKIGHCALLLFFMSSNSVQSIQCHNEWRFALDLNKPIVPVRIDGCSPPSNLEHIHYLDVQPDIDSLLDDKYSNEVRSWRRFDSSLNMTNMTSYRATLTSRYPVNLDFYQIAQKIKQELKRFL